MRKEFKNMYMRWKTGDKTYGIQKPTQHFVSDPPLSRNSYPWCARNRMSYIPSICAFDSRHNTGRLPSSLECSRDKTSGTEGFFYNIGFDRKYEGQHG